MPDDTFHRDFIALIEHRHWEKSSPDEIDHDVQFMLSASLEIYMNGRKPPGPRPMRDAAMTGRKPPPPRPNDPGLLLGAFGLSSLREFKRRPRGIRSRPYR